MVSRRLIAVNPCLEPAAGFADAFLAFSAFDFWRFPVSFLF